MSNINRIEIVDADTGEVHALNAGMLVGDVRDRVLSRRRQDVMSIMWKDMTEAQQRDEIQAMTLLAEDLVTAVVDLVAAGGHDVIHAKLDNFKIKDGAVTLTAKGAADDGALLALNHVGHKNLKIIVANAEQFDQQREEIAPDSDQPSMFTDADESPDEGGLDEDTVNQIHAEMDAADAADAEVMNDDDDLHAEGDQDDAPDGEPEDYQNQGFQARLTGAGPDENPYDGGEQSHSEWVDGWTTADLEIDKLERQGYEARYEGQGPDKGPGEPNSDLRRFWMVGYEKAKEEQAKEEESTSADVD